MPEMLALPVLAILLPGLVAYVLGRAFKSVWPGLILVLVALGTGMYFMSQASGAAWNDGAALNNLFAAFGLSLPALISALAGGALAHAHVRTA